MQTKILTLILLILWKSCSNILSKSFSGNIKLIENDTFSKVKHKNEVWDNSSLKVNSDVRLEGYVYPHIYMS